MCRLVGCVLSYTLNGYVMVLLQALFGDSLHADGNGTLTFMDYLKAVNKRMPGRAAAAAGKGGERSRAGAGIRA